MLIQYYYKYKLKHCIKEYTYVVETNKPSNAPSKFIYITNLRNTYKNIFSKERSKKRDWDKISINLVAISEIF